MWCMQPADCPRTSPIILVIDVLRSRQSDRDKPRPGRLEADAGAGLPGLRSILRRDMRESVSDGRATLGLALLLGAGYIRCHR